MNNILEKIQKFIFYFLVIIFPFFFLTITNEFFFTNKFYLFLITTLILLIFQLINLIFSKKISLNEKTFDLSLMFFLTSIIISTALLTNNKIQTLTDINFGTGIFIIGTIYYFIISRKNNIKIEKIFYLKKPVSLFLSLITIFFSFNPLKKIALPESLNFLKIPFFTPAGNYLNLIFLLGLFLLINIITFEIKNNKKLIISLFLTTVNFIALLLTIYSVITNNLFVFPPYSLSWYAVLETFKNIKTSFFGFGLGSFINIFPLVKNISYNQSNLWNIFSFNYASSTLFQIIIETGLLGLISFSIIIYLLIKKLIEIRNSKNILIFIYLLIFIIFFPPFLTFWFYFFTFLSLITTNRRQEKEIYFESLPYFILITLTIFIILISSVIYLTIRNYSGEIHFKKSLQAISKNNIVESYQNLKKARIINPYEEKYIINFSQLNLNYALSFLDYLTKKEKIEKISEQDKQKIFQAIQASIAEGKELIRLNPNRADYYRFLANVYKNLINIAQEADLWAISLYQRAINLDPHNPIYRLELGGLYYLLRKYPDSINLFRQAILIKPNWSNGYYNLSWAYYQNKEYDKASQIMENVLKLIDKKTQFKDWEKANSELEKFKKKLAEENKQASESSNLQLPKEPSSELKPKIKL